MKKICVNLSYCLGLGDLLSSTPIIRKISNSYGVKVDIITNNKEVFLNNPFVNQIYLPSEFDFLDSTYEVLKTFDPFEENSKPISLKHNLMDIRQYHAVKLGMSLSKDEMDMVFIPNEFETIPNLPENFVLIHPVQNWASRTWSKENWNDLITKLNGDGIPVVAIGQDSSEIGTFNTPKPVFDVNIQLGLNLMNSTNLSQCWWLIQKSICFVTMDSGLLHLAGTTPATIIQLGSSINKEFRAPYRNGSQDYKYYYIGGSCNLSCASNLKYAIKEWNTILAVPPLVGCLEQKPTFECHPSSDSVYNTIKSNITPKYYDFQNKKKIVVIGTYPSTEYTENMLNECIDKISLLGFDIMVVSHYPIPNYIQKKVKYYIYDADNSLDPIENTPYAYFTNSSFSVILHKKGFITTICRNISNSIKFIESKNYDFFYYMESDNLFNYYDLTKLNELSTQMFQDNKKSILFEYESHNQKMYESLIFGGTPKFFLDNLPLPIYQDDFRKFHCELTLELHYYHYLSKFENESLIVKSTSKNFFNKSTINKISNCGFCEVIEDKTNGGYILYMSNYMENDHHIYYSINDGGKIDLGPGGWYFIHVSLGDKLNVKMYDLENIIEKEFDINEDNLPIFSTIGTIKFN